MFPPNLNITEGKAMRNFEDFKNMEFDLSSIGGNHPYTLHEIIKEFVHYKRNNFIQMIFSLNDNQKDCSKLFDAISFIAAISDFGIYGCDTNYEGEIIYDVIAGSDWVWHCKTTVTWNSILPYTGGYYNYHTEVVPNENVNPSDIRALTGTRMEIIVFKNNLKKFTLKEAIQRDISISET